MNFGKHITITTKAFLLIVITILSTTTTTTTVIIVAAPANFIAQPPSLHSIAQHCTVTS